MRRRVRICNAGDLLEGAFVCNEGVIVMNIEGELYAYVNECPHLHRAFDDVNSMVRAGCVLRCGAHTYEYDCRTGQQIRSAVQKATRPLTPVHLDRVGQELWAELDL